MLPGEADSYGDGMAAEEGGGGSMRGACRLLKMGGSGDKLPTRKQDKKEGSDTV